MATRRLELTRTLGPLVVAWIEENLVHGPGDVQGQPLELDDEQARFIFHAYELDEGGKRLIRRAVFSRAKGRAKSELAAALACAEALGPVRFSGWDHDGRPLGAPVTAPYIPILATEEGQAGHVYQHIEFMLREGAVSRLPGLDVGLTRTYLPGGGFIRPLTAKATSKEGGRETFAVFDETHLYVTAELRNLHATIRRNLSKRKAAEPWALETTTMYAPDEESIAELSHRYAQSIASGERKDRSFLFDHREAGGELDFDDDGELRAALEDAYGDAASWMDLDRLVAEARDPLTLKSDFSRYFLNRPTKRDAGQWISPAQWDACLDVDAEIPDGSAVAVGVDIGLVHDASAVSVAWKRDDGKVVVDATVWAAAANAVADVHVPGGVVDLGLVEEHIRALAQRFYVAHVAYDPRFFERSAQVLAQEGLPLVQVPQNSAHMADAYESLYAAVVEQRLAHAGGHVLTSHAMAAAAELTDRGWKVRKLRQPGRIDALVAASMALHGAQEYVEMPFILR